VTGLFCAQIVNIRPLVAFPAPSALGGDWGWGRSQKLSLKITCHIGSKRHGFCGLIILKVEVNKKKATILGEKLDAYMRYRAAREETNYTLTPAYFRDAILIGMTRFFGITFRDLELKNDEQNPDAFTTYQLKGGSSNSK
jgi:hypothetical protein